MTELLALAPTFWKGTAVTVAGVVLFIGSVYVLLAAFFGLRMGYLVLAVGLFGWMILLSALWVFGAPGTPKNLGPRGTEPHWEVFAAAAGPPPAAEYAQVVSYPGPPWREPTDRTRPSVDTVATAVQNYLAARAVEELGLPAEEEGQEGPPEAGQTGGERFHVEPAMFVVEDVRFATADDGTFLASAESFFTFGGPRVTVFLRHDSGNVQVYSWAFLIGSVLGLAVHVPFLDRAEKRRKAVLTGGTSPPWYGPA